MRAVILAAVCAALLVTACGDGDGDGAASSGDGFCAEAEQLNATNEQLLTMLGDLLRRATEGPMDDETRREAMETFLTLGDLAAEALDALDAMVASADGRLRRDLEAVVDHNRSQLGPLIEAESVEEIDAAMDEPEPEPPPDLGERAQRIDDATQERCGVAFAESSFVDVLDAAAGPVPWPDFDLCGLLPAEALTDAGVSDHEGTLDDSSPVVRCEWGEPYAVDGTHLQLGLWDPPFPQVLEDYWEERGEVAGRTAYVETGRTRDVSCHLAVDNGEYLVTVLVEIAEAPAGDDGDAACRIAEGAAASALPSLPAED